MLCINNMYINTISDEPYYESTKINLRKKKSILLYFLNCIYIKYLNIIIYNSIR